jgi:hypothetical protein
MKRDSDPILFRIDLEKAESAPHHVYFIRLLWALNDLLSTLQASDCIKESTELTPTFKPHLQAYFLRMQQAHLIEACTAFVCSVRPQGTKKQSAVYRWIATHLGLLKQFNELLELVDKPLYRKLNNCRDSLIFHYNHKGNSKLTIAAFKSLTKEWKSLKTSGQCDLNLLQRSDSPFESKFF